VVGAELGFPEPERFFVELERLLGATGGRVGIGQARHAIERELVIRNLGFHNGQRFFVDLDGITVPPKR
jgi:hypothetical protein